MLKWKVLLLRSLQGPAAPSSVNMADRQTCVENQESWIADVWLDHVIISEFRWNGETFRAYIFTQGHTIISPCCSTLDNHCLSIFIWFWISWFWITNCRLLVGWTLLLLDDVGPANVVCLTLNFLQKPCNPLSSGFEVWEVHLWGCQKPITDAGWEGECDEIPFSKFKQMCHLMQTESSVKDICRWPFQTEQDR